MCKRKFSIKIFLKELFQKFFTRKSWQGRKINIGLGRAVGLGKEAQQVPVHTNSVKIKVQKCPSK